MKLVIVESPSKAKTINKYLGSSYKVIASYGHIRKLVSKNGSVDPDNKFQMNWEESPYAKKHLKTIIENIKLADELFLATDPDREGEAISWHIVNYLQNKKLLKKNIKVQRVVFNAITKQEILKAFDSPRELDTNLISAYLARTALDYLVGFGISPVLWRKLPGSRSAGRVQSVALRLIAERENEIENFKPIEYWDMNILLEDSKKNELNAKLYQLEGNTLEKLSIKNQEEAQRIKEKILSHDYTLASKKNKQTSRNPFAPFTTSTLQQDAFNKLGFTAKKTMQIAQKLYEGVKLEKETVGLITYMRTDATQIDPTFITVIRNYIKDTYSSDYLSSSIRVHKTKAKNAQEAHEAIRPTDIKNTPEKIAKFLEPDMQKLYGLIWRRSIASQMEAAKYDICTFEITNSDQSVTLRSSGSIMLFDGFYKVYKVETNNQNDEDKILPDIKEGTSLYPQKVDEKQHFTEPPARFSEASLVKTLEELGIGRPSTYAGIISVLQERNYTKIEKKRFIPEARGRILNVFLTSYFTQYLEYNFTANLEEQLDSISNGEKSWLDTLEAFWGPFNDNLKDVSNKNILEILEKINEVALPQFVGENTNCPKCKTGSLQIKTSKFGAFLGCTNYPECTYSHQLESNEDEEHEGTSSNTSFSDNTSLGKDGNIEIILKKGPYGFYIERAEKKPKRISIPSSIDPTTLTLEKAIFLSHLPLQLNKDISFSIGPYGPYIKQGKEFVSYKDDIFSVTLEKAEILIKQNQEKKNGVCLGTHPKSKKDVLLKHGKYGAYISYNNSNIKIPKEYKNKELTLDDSVSIIDNS